MIAMVLVKLLNHPPALSDLPRTRATLGERRNAPFAFLFFTLLLCFNASAQFQLSEDFGNMGKASFAPDIYNDAIDILTLDNDTLLVLANSGHIDSVFNHDIVVTKLTPNGDIYPDYGYNGMSRFDFHGLDISTADEMLLLDDGRVMILGSGYALDSNTYLPTCLISLLPNGSIDSTFGNNGTLTIQFAGVQDYPNSIEQDAMGRILVSGSTLDTSHAHSDVPVIARMDVNGNLDPTFGEGGKTYLRFPNGIIQETRENRHFSGGVIYDLLETDDGKLLISGAHSNGANYLAFIACLHSDGSLDSTFFSDGYIAFDLYTYENSIGVKLLKGNNNTVWFGAHTQALDYNDFFFGKIDLTHMSYDVGTIDIDDNEDFVMDMLMGNNDLPVMIGSSRKPENNVIHYRSDYFTVVQLTADNFPYSSHNFTMEFNPGFQSGAIAATYQSDGRLICLGFSNIDSIGTNQLALIGLEYPSTSIEENPSKLQAQIYPNPTHDNVSIDLNETGEYFLTLYNSLGQVVIEKSLHGSSNEIIHLAHLKSGSYLARITNLEGSIYSSIILKQ